MAFEGAQMVPVYDMNKSDNAGMMGGGAGWMWVIMLFFLLSLVMILIISRCYVAYLIQYIHHL